MSNKGTAIEIVNAAQAQVIEVAKNYADGFETSLNHAKGYGLLFGTALNQLKEITPHGQFTMLAEQTFPKHKLRWLQYLMNYAEARKLKNAVTAFLPDGQLLLDLPDKDREKLFAEVEELTKGKSIEEIALDVLKKKHAEKLKEHPDTPEDKAAAKLQRAIDMVKACRQTLAITRMNKDLGLVPDAELQALEDERIELGNFIKLLRKNRKAAKKGGAQ